MTILKGSDLRDVLPHESFTEPEVLQGQGFTLQPRDMKVFKPTNAPVYLYDVHADGAGRVGIASLVLEADTSQVAGYGHACANLLESHPDPDLLQKVGDLLVSYGIQQGLPTVRIVVPEDDHKSIQACESLQNVCRQEELERDGQRFAWFEYSASESGG